MRTYKKCKWKNHPFLTQPALKIHSKLQFQRDARRALAAELLTSHICTRIQIILKIVGTSFRQKWMPRSHMFKNRTSLRREWLQLMSPLYRKRVCKSVIMMLKSLKPNWQRKNRFWLAMYLCCPRSSLYFPLTLQVQKCQKPKNYPSQSKSKDKTLSRAQETGTRPRNQKRSGRILNNRQL